MIDQEALTSSGILKPFFLFSETWYLIEYKDDENLWVVHENEIRHIFSEDEEDAIQPGDIVSAIWTPNGQYYDAKVLKVGGKLSVVFLGPWYWWYQDIMLMESQSYHACTVDCCQHHNKKNNFASWNDMI